MQPAMSVLRDGFGRLPESVHGVVEGLTDDELAYRLDADANTIAWLVWHLTRVQDDHIAGAAASEQIWTSAGWADRFGLPFPVSAHGYGQSSEEVAQVRAPASLLVGYFDAVYARSIEFLDSLSEADLDRIVDTRFDPPVTLGVRLVSVLADDLEHVGQAALIRGVVLRARS
jgi:hypothetical protein